MKPKKCMVPGCTNKSRNSSKTFLRITPYLAPKWCARAGVTFYPKKEYYCCEDHLKLEDAVDNYMCWKLTGAHPRLNKLYIPCFEEKVEARAEQQHYLLEPNNPKDQNKIIQDNPSQDGAGSELLRYLLEPSNPGDHTNTTQKHYVQNISSKMQIGVQCKPITATKGTNYRCHNIKCYKENPEDLLVPTQKSSSFECIEADTEYKPSTNGSTTEMEHVNEIQNLNDCDLRNQMLTLVQNYPKMYIGLPKSFYWIINFIASQYKTDALFIIITLYKIKQNDTFFKISHLFRISRLQLATLFPRTLEVLANFFQNLICFPDLKTTKKNLPLVFKIRFSNVQCILDCFEIEIEKPSDPVSQSQTWSQYKSCNTAKYLVGCTPDGFINFISKGYVGRTSDKAIVENSKLLDYLPENTVVMADRGFKAVESVLAVKNIKLLRPASVYAGIKPDKADVLQTKVIASLRIHVERIIRRLREFNILKPHSVVRHQHVSYLDHIVIIACGLCNLQNKIIKDK